MVSCEVNDRNITMCDSTEYFELVMLVLLLLVVRLGIL